MQNTLFTGDNLYILHGINSETVDLIYLDPPFNSKRFYSAPVGTKAAGASFKDMWTWEDVDEYYLEKLTETHPFLVKFIQSIEGLHGKAMMSYVTYMFQRIVEMHRILKPTGSLYLHCDPTASHYLKLILDEVFGKNNFQNEIVWSYESGGRAKNRFSRKHDNIFFYRKSEDCNFYLDQVGETRGIKKRNNMRKAVDEDGRIFFSIKSNGKVYKYYEDSVLSPSDVWDINHLHQKHPERTGYPTQKPLALLERIVQASSKEGDVVLDPFCGCATTCIAAEKLQRKWIGIDIEKKAVEVLIERLEKEGEYDSKGTTMSFRKKGEDFIHRIDIPKRTDIQEEPITPETKNDIKKRLFAQQAGHCNGCNLEFNIYNLEIDHIIPKAKSGGDYFENYQLLCGSCNRIKGMKPMEYLRMKIKVREEMLREKYTFGE